jgi:hypothetical protein
MKLDRRWWGGVLAAAFASLHLSYIVWRTEPLSRGAFSIPSALRPAWDAYGNLSGACSGYSYFAPSVASQVIAHAEWLDQEGVPHHERRDGRAGESDLRTTAMFLMLQQLEATDMTARALGADVLQRHPEAEAVTVTLALYGVPTMEEYRGGLRPWEEVFYRAVVARRHDLRRATEGGQS